MELHERLGIGGADAEDAFAELKNRVHQSVISELGPQLYARDLDPATLRDRAIAAIRAELDGEAGLSRDDRERLIAEIADDTLAHGPIERLLADPEVTEIMVNGANEVWVERGGRLHDAQIRFNDESHLRRIINKMVAQIGRRIDEASPMVDARLPDGSRVNAIIPPLSLSGPLLTVRKFTKNRLELDAFIELGTLTRGGDRVPRPLRSRAAQHPRLGRHRLGQDDAAERPVDGDPGRRTHRHDRGRGRAAAQSAPRPAPGIAPREHRGRRLGDDPRPRAQLAAHAPRPHHRRRGSRRGGARHVAGHEHRPRRLADDAPRQHAARRARPRGDDGADGRLRPAGPRDPPAGRRGARPDRSSGAHAGRRAPRHRDHRGPAAWSPT